MKTINKNLTNNEIYSYALALMNDFPESDAYMPAAVAYSIQKNKTTIVSLGEEIEKSRLSIIQHYELDKFQEGDEVDPAIVEKANAELMDLLNIEQEVKIYTFDIEVLNDVKLTSAQMQAIMFMIED